MTPNPSIERTRPGKPGLVATQKLGRSSMKLKERTSNMCKSWQAAPNPSIERTAPGKPGAASPVKR